MYNIIISTSHKQYPFYPDLEAAIEGTTAPEEIIKQLELVPVNYLNFDFRPRVGQLVVAQSVAGEIQEIFGRIRDGRFPIRSIVPMTHFGENDFESIDKDNCSAYCCRFVAGTDRLSQHAFGRAVDINPLENPYMNSDGSAHEGSFPYRPYDEAAPGTILRGGVVVAAFLDKGWEWGGDWTDGAIDLQHFNKPQ